MHGKLARLIFLGDVAHPGAISCPESPVCFEGATTIANLEGSLVPGRVDRVLQYGKVFNHVSVLPYLRALNVGLVSLANNHVFDLDRSMRAVLESLGAEGIAACGAGDNRLDAAQPALLVREGNDYVFLAFGWGPIGCAPAGERSAGVNPLTRRNVLESVSAAREKYPHATLVLLMHWDYELERFPQPAHRQLAFAAIDQGADAVIGHHSHCVQGIEWRRGAPIVYGLGNWWFPQGAFMGGRLRFPEYTVDQLAFEWGPGVPDGVCHWFEYQRASHGLRYAGSEVAKSSTRVRDLTPFGGMSHKEYCRWFAVNRLKRKALPIYADMGADARNMAFDAWVAFRHALLRGAIRAGLHRKD